MLVLLKVTSASASSKNINCVTIIITLEGIEKIKPEKKMTAKVSEEHFFHQHCKKTATNTEWHVDFDWLFTSHGYLILTFYWFISAG